MSRPRRVIASAVLPLVAWLLVAPPLAAVEARATATAPPSGGALPPVLLRWPLDPRPRAPAPGTPLPVAPAAAAPVPVIPLSASPEPMPPLQAEAAPVPPAPGGSPAAPSEALVPQPAVPQVVVAARVPGEVPPPAVAPSQPAVAPPEDVAPPLRGGPQPGPSNVPPTTLAPPGEATPQPVPARVPVPPARPAPAPGAPAATVPETPTRRAGPAQREREIGVLPGAGTGLETAVPAPRIATGFGTTSLVPPTAEVPLWTFSDPGGVTVDATFQERVGEWVILRGQVDVRAGTDRIQADEVRLNETERRLEAEGNVVLDHLGSRVAGSRMEYDLDTNTGTVHDAVGYTGQDLNFTGERVEKIGENRYAVYKGTFTSCTQPLPIWRIDASKAIIHVDHFVYVWNPRIMFKRVPAYWLPWAAFPVKQHRATGFMVPKISQSSRRGTSIEEEYFWAINRSTDITFGGKLWTDYGWRGDVKTRWHYGNMPAPGFIEATYLQSDQPPLSSFVVEEQRYQVRFEHRQTLADVWDLTLRGEIGSDQILEREETPAGDRAHEPIFNQRLTLQRRWGKHSLNVQLENDERERALTVMGTPAPLPPMTRFGANGVKGTTTEHNSTLPSVEYRAAGLQLAGKRWASLSMEGSVAQVTRSSRDRVDLYYPNISPGQAGVYRLQQTTADHDYQTADFYPQIKFPLGPAYLQIVPSVGVRGTWWNRLQSTTTTTESIVVPSPGTGQVDFAVGDGEDTSTFLWNWDAGLRIEGPDFQRIYRKSAASGQKKWQHLIEPLVEYRRSPQIDGLPNGFKFVDSAPHANHYLQRFTEPEERLRLSLANTLRSKRVPLPGQDGESTRDVLIWTVSTDYDFDEAISQRTLNSGGTTRLERNWFSDVTSDVNFRPTDDIHFSLRNTYDVLQDDITQTSVTGGVDGDWGYTDVSFRSTRRSETLGESKTNLDLTGEVWFYKNGRIRLGYDLSKSFNRGTAGRSSWPYRRVVASYFNQCCGVSLSWEDNDDRSVVREQEWTFIVTLKDLGNYLRYRERSN